jgi:hypothetical protein
MRAGLNRFNERTSRRSLYADLLRAPYKEGGRDPKTGIDCLGVVWEILRRIHGDEVLHRFTDYPVTLAPDPEASALRAHLYTLRDDWVLLSNDEICYSKSLVGDVVLQMIGSAHDTPHVSVVVWNTEPVTLLTAHRARGVVAVPARQAQNIVAVYRLRE